MLIYNEPNSQVAANVLALQCERALSSHTKQVRIYTASGDMPLK